MGAVRPRRRGSLTSTGSAETGAAEHGSVQNGGLAMVGVAVVAALVGALVALAARPWLPSADVSAPSRSAVEMDAPSRSTGRADSTPVPTTDATTTASTSASTSASPSTSTSTSTTTTIPAPVLVWADEFDGEAGRVPEPSRWRFEIGGHGWGNAQLEFADESHARLDGVGRLLITSEPTAADTPLTCWYGPCRFVSSRLTTEGLFAQQYGRIEVRAALPGGDATWPAFWMLGTNRPAVGWPASGEIDILEHVGRSGNEVHGALHGPGYSGGSALVGGTMVDNVSDFHVYAVEWRTDSIVWFVDDRPYHRVNRDQVATWPFDQPFHLMLNLAIGGTLGGEPTEADAGPRTFIVDHVRVFDVGG